MLWEIPINQRIKQIVFIKKAFQLNFIYAFNLFDPDLDPHFFF